MVLFHYYGGHILSSHCWFMNIHTKFRKYNFLVSVLGMSELAFIYLFISVPNGWDAYLLYRLYDYQEQKH